MGETDEDLCKLALDLGWLNCVGVAEENPDETVYAFFHPSFQEYFAFQASLNIDTWDYFLPKKHINQPVVDSQTGKYKRYRIFEPQWQEVILLWLEDNGTERREEFAQTLLKFDNGLDNFWFYQDKIYYFLEGYRNLFSDSYLNDTVEIYDHNEDCYFDEPIFEYATQYIGYFLRCEDPKVIKKYARIFKFIQPNINDDEAFNLALNYGLDIEMFDKKRQKLLKDLLDKLEINDSDPKVMVLKLISKFEDSLPHKNLSVPFDLVLFECFKYILENKLGLTLVSQIVQYLKFYCNNSFWIEQISRCSKINIR